LHLDWDCMRNNAQLLLGYQYGCHWFYGWFSLSKSVKIRACFGMALSHSKTGTNLNWFWWWKPPIALVWITFMCTTFSSSNPPKCNILEYFINAELLIILKKRTHSSDKSYKKTFTSFASELYFCHILKLLQIGRYLYSEILHDTIIIKEYHISSNRRTAHLLFQSVSSMSIYLIISFLFWVCSFVVSKERNFNFHHN